MLSIGSKAPDFTIQLDNGQLFRLRENVHRHSHLLVFLPHDFKKSELESAYHYLHQLQQLHNQGAVILTISPDPLPAIKQLFSLYQFSFAIAQDLSLEVCRLYQVVWLRGLAIRNVTYVIDKKGLIVARMNHQLLMEKSWEHVHRIIKESEKE
jgi:peroxiredoxin Q/BCP